MAYQVFLVDGINSVELDCEEVDMLSTFSIADIKDISIKKSNIKTITFKGTKTNNNAFGTMFNPSRTTDDTIANKLFWNYNPLRAVDCYIYEDSMLVFKGSLRVDKMSLLPGSELYNTIVTGGFIDFRNVLQDKLLTDLDFTDLKHRLSANNVSNSWDNSTERFNSTTSTFTSSAYALGSGYVYPNIDYGQVFNSTIVGGNDDINHIHYANMKPAIFVQEYLDRIFNQPSLPGFSYEIKGDTDFKNLFKSLIISDVQEGFTNSYSGFITSASKPILVIESNVGSAYGTDGQYKLMNISTIVEPPPNTVTSLYKKFSTYNNVLEIDKTFTSNGYLSATFSTIHNPRSYSSDVVLELVERVSENNQNPLTGSWQVLATKSVTLTAGQTLTGTTLTADVGEHQFLKTNQVAIRVRTTGGTFGSDITYSITSLSLSIPKDLASVLKTDVDMSSTTGSVITPRPPDNIKQIDFLKSIIGQFDMYAYTKTENPKHIIFERYNDYWAKAAMQNVVANAIDWTNKIDYSKPVIRDSNLSLPKAYQFTYKADGDFLNDSYKKKYDKVYGEFNFTDGYGLVDAKKVELIFSPSPVTTYVGTDRKFACQYQPDGVLRKPIKTNIKIMFYNGLRSCIPWSLYKESYASGVWSKSLLFTKSVYPNASNYYYDNDGVPIYDLNFGRPNELYFTASTDFINAKTAYETYYLDQTSELTNINVSYWECSVLLNEVDIANLDLSVPVFIDMGENSHAYFKVMEVIYYDNNTPSKVQLQRIVL